MQIGPVRYAAGQVRVVLYRPRGFCGANPNYPPQAAFNKTCLKAAPLRDGPLSGPIGTLAEMLLRLHARNSSGGFCAWG